jgi:hypothetical protein
LLAASSEENKDRNEFVVDEVVLFADRNERGISRLEPAALSVRLEGRFAGQDDVDLVGCMSHRGIRRGGNADEHAYFEVGDSCTTFQPPFWASSCARTSSTGKYSIIFF